MKIVINCDYGVFDLSNEAMKYLNEHGLSNSYIIRFDMGKSRDNPILVQCVEELGERAGTWTSTLKIVEIPDDVKWRLTEYDGKERIEELHRIWD